MGNHLSSGHFSPDIAVLAIIIQPHSLHKMPILLSQLLQITRLSSFCSLLIVNQRDLFLFISAASFLLSLLMFKRLKVASCSCSSIGVSLLSEACIIIVYPLFIVWLLYHLLMILSSVK